jgi:hypothetical protein
MASRSRRDVVIERHPEPPDSLDAWELPLVEVAPPWYRCHRTAREAIFFNTGRIGRFNAPDGEYGVLYLGRDPFCAFIETFGQAMRRDDRGLSVIGEYDLAERCLCCIDVKPGRGPFRLVDLTGAGLARIGADNRLNTTTTDRGLPQRWALALWRHPQRPDGLLYRVGHDPDRSGIALFDRVGDILIAHHADNVLARPDALFPILSHYGFSLNPSNLQRDPVLPATESSLRD